MLESDRGGFLELSAGPAAAPRIISTGSAFKVPLNCQRTFFFSARTVGPSPLIAGFLRSLTLRLLQIEQFQAQKQQRDA